MNMNDIKNESIAASLVLVGLTIAYMGMHFGLVHKINKRIL